MTTTYTDTRDGRGGPIGDVPETVDGSSGQGDTFGASPQSLATSAGSVADAKAAADTAGLLAAGKRQDADTARRQV